MSSRAGKRGAGGAEAIAKGSALQLAGDYAGAVRAYESAIRVEPRRADLRHNLGSALRSAGRLEEAEAAFRKSLTLAPNEPRLRFAVGSALLSLGHYAEGWPLYEARYDVPGLNVPKPGLPFPEWGGESVAGKTIAIFPEQGLGDQIQFARFVRTLRDRGARVVLLCHPALVRLFEASLDAEVFAGEGMVEFPDPDYWTTITSLPAKLGVTLEELDGAPYLRWPGAPVAEGGRAPRIGLAWRGNPSHRNDANRSLTPGAADALLSLPGEVVDLDPKLTGAKDFADTAALIGGLDLVIAVDTSVAHAAGALGKPCWVLLSAIDTDWRWLRERADSPWYGSARLYRQRRPGDWAGVIAEVRRDLERRFA
ncbi:tetratricopeptide repeat protein [Phenylobacterium sp.]|uniref:tetratricopeptide repeat protein n=1 Tax=Phenylobacterium sp. TaxID=1871053 RepID=UPI0035B279BC